MSVQRWALDLRPRPNSYAQLVPLEDGPWMKHADVRAMVEAEWDDECCGHRNPVVCQACRVYERILHIIGGEDTTDEYIPWRQR